MASYTPNLNLLMKDPVTDGADTFNIETMLNENWEKIDRQVLRAIAAAAAYDAGKTYQQGDFCTQGGLLYRANQAITQPEAWTAGHWTDISITDVIRGLTAADVGATNKYESITIDGDHSKVTMSSPGWYRVMSVPYPGDGYATLVRLYHNYSSGSPSDILLYVNFYKYNPTVTIISNTPGYDYNTYTIDDFRITSSADRMYLDLHYALNVANNVSFDALYSTCGYKNVTKFTAENFAPVDDTPAEETIIATASWLNPPMGLGVEYRTTERWNKKLVYRKLINFGQLPNASRKTIFHNIQNVQSIVDIMAIASNGAIMNDMELAGSNFTANNSVIACQSSVDQSSFTATVLLKYTKTSD